MVSSWFFWPFHESSAPYRAADCTTASWICRTSPGTSPWVRVKPLIWITAFAVPNSKTVVATVSRVRAIYLTEVPEAMNPRSSTNDRDVMNGLTSITVLKTPLIQIKKRTGKTGDPCGIPFSICVSSLLCPSMT